MATYKHLRSSTANKRPTTSIADGQLAINTNTASPGLFFKDSAGTGIVKVGPVHVGTTAPNVSPAAGGSSGNYTGEQWLDTSVSPNQMKVWNGSAWVGIVADELPVSKLQDGIAGQIVQTDSAGTGVEWSSTTNLPIGGAGAPAYSFQSDSNTGIYSPGADQVAITTSGTGRLFVASDGKVGIGTSSPGVKLEVSGASNSNEIRSSDGTITGQWYQDINGYGVFGTASNHSQVFRTNAAERLRITSDGKVGIGTSSPSRTLDVTGTARISSVLTMGSYIQGTTQLDLYGDSSSSSVVRIDSSGRLLVGTSTAPTGARSQFSKLSVYLNTQSTAEGSQLNLVGGARGDLNAGNKLGQLIFTDTTDGEYGKIACELDAATGANDFPGRLVFSTTADGAASPTERLRITSDGKVGIGTSSPSSRLHVSGTTAEAWVSDGTNTIVTGGWDGSTQYIKSLNIGTAFTPLTHQATAHIFRGASSEYARIDSSGRLLVGTSSSRSYTSLGNPRLQVEGTAFADSSIGATNNQTTVDGAYLVLAKTRGTSLNSYTSVQAGDLLGSIWFEGADGTALVRGAVIEAVVDGTPGTSDMPGRLVFSTTADGASSPTERLRIDSAGAIRSKGAYWVTEEAGATSDPGNGTAQYTAYNAYGATILGQGSSYDIGFLNKGGNFAGYVATGATTITTSSDERLKENFAPIENALPKVASMRHETGNYKSDPHRTVAFLVAQDVDKYWPFAVDKSNPDGWGVNYNWIIPLHGAAITELKAMVEAQAKRIETLEAKVAALESA